MNFPPRDPPGRTPEDFQHPTYRRRLNGSVRTVLLACALVGPAWADDPPGRVEYQKDAIALKNALQADPDNRELRKTLGLLHLEWGSAALAEQEFRRAIELGMPAESVQFPLAEALLMQGKFQDVIDYLAPLALMSAADQARLLAYRGDAWLGLGQIDKARSEYSLALQMDGACPAAKLGLARVAMSRNDIKAADRLVREVLSEHPDDPKAWSLQGALFESAKRGEDAEASYLRAIGSKRYSPVERASLAMIRLNAGKLKEAEADVAILKREAGNLFLTDYADGLLKLRQGKYQDAQTALEVAARKNPSFRAVDYHLGVAHYYQKHPREAEAYLQSYLGAEPHAAEPRVLLALIRLNEKDSPGARELLNAALEQQPDNRFALQLLSELELAEGNSKRGLELLQRIARLPKKAAPGRGLGLEVLQAGEKQALLDGLAKAAEIDDRMAEQLTAVILEKWVTGDARQARELIEKIRMKAPNDPLAYRLMGLSFLLQNNPAKAKAAFETAYAKSPGNPVIAHDLAQLALRQGNAGQARTLYEQAASANPHDPSPRIRLAELDELEGHPAAAEERLAALIKDQPKALRPRMALASHFLKLGDPARAVATLQAVQVEFADNTGFMTLLIHALLESHQPQNAAESAAALLRRQPQSAMAHFLLARAHAEMKETAKVRAELDRAVAADPNFLPARLARIRLLVQEKDQPEAEAQLQALVHDHPDSPEVMELQVALAEASQDPKQALAVYRKAYRTFPSESNAIRLARGEWLAGDQKKALQIIDEWIRAHPKAIAARIMAAELHEARPQPDAAIRRLHEVLMLDPNNVHALNGLAWLLRPTAPEKALELARAAASIAPEAPDVLDTLVMIQLDRGQAGEALDTLRRAVGLAPQSRPVRYHLALALERAGRKEEAVRVLTDVLADPQPFPEQPEAHALLDRLSTKQP